MYGGSTFYKRIFYFPPVCAPEQHTVFSHTLKLLHAYDSSMIKHALHFAINVKFNEKEHVYCLWLILSEWPSNC